MTGQPWTFDDFDTLLRWATEAPPLLFDGFELDYSRADDDVVFYTGRERVDAQAPAGSGEG